MSLTLTKITETSSTITLGWMPPADVGGYVLYANGQIVSVATARLKDGSLREEAKFSKTSPGPPFEIVALCRTSLGVYRVEGDTYPDAAPIPPQRGIDCSIRRLDSREVIPVTRRTIPALLSLMSPTRTAACS